MTDRLKGAIITFDQDIREDDAEGVMAALGLIKGVVSVAPVQASPGDAIIAMRLKVQMAVKLQEFAESLLIEHLGKA